MHLLDKEYLKEHLKYYIEFQLKQGYELADVKEALVKYGYPQKFVAEVCHIIHCPEPSASPLFQHSKEELDTDAYNYILNMLLDYMTKEMKHGYTLNAVKKALINYGHVPHIVEDAARLIHEGKVIDYGNKMTNIFKLPSYLVLSISLLIAFVSLFMLSVVTNMSIIIILFDFIPTFISLIIVYLALVTLHKKGIRRFLPLAAIAAAIGCFIVLLQYSTLIRATVMTTLLILNVVLSFICSLVLVVFSRVEDEHFVKKPPKKTVQAAHKEEKKEEKKGITEVHEMSKEARKILEKAGINEEQKVVEKSVGRLP